MPPALSISTILRRPGSRSFAPDDHARHAGTDDGDVDVLGDRRHARRTGVNGSLRVLGEPLVGASGRRGPRGPRSCAWRAPRSYLSRTASGSNAGEDERVSSDGVMQPVPPGVLDRVQSCLKDACLHPGPSAHLAKLAAQRSVGRRRRSNAFVSRPRRRRAVPSARRSASDRPRGRARRRGGRPPPGMHRRHRSTPPPRRSLRSHGRRRGRHAANRERAPRRVHRARARGSPPLLAGSRHDRRHAALA